MASSTSTRDLSSPDARSAARLAHPSSWRSRLDLAVDAETARLHALPSVKDATISVTGPAAHLTLAVDCTLTSEIAPLSLMRLLDDELPARLASEAGHPITARQLDLAVRQHGSAAAA